MKIQSLSLKVHLYRFENLPISLSSYWNIYVENFTLKHILLLEICPHEICKMFVYKHKKTIQCVKN